MHGRVRADIETISSFRMHHQNEVIVLLNKLTGSSAQVCENLVLIPVMWQENLGGEDFLFCGQS